MWSRDLREVDGFAIFAEGLCAAVALVVAKAVLDANDDPEGCRISLVGHDAHKVTNSP